MILNNFDSNFCITEKEMGIYFTHKVNTSPSQSKLRPSENLEGVINDPYDGNLITLRKQYINFDFICNENPYLQVT